jgi:hypothetical protein
VSNLPHEIQHPYTPGPDGSCLQAISDRACGMSGEHECHWWPFDDVTSQDDVQEAPDPESLQFDWHKADEFLSWLIVSTVPRRDQAFERLSGITERFTRCKLEITLNGVPLGVQAFLDGVRHNIEYTGRQHARELVSDVGLSEIEDAVSEARDAIRKTLRRRLTAAGVDLGEED